MQHPRPRPVPSHLALPSRTRSAPIRFAALVALALLAGCGSSGGGGNGDGGGGGDDDEESRPETHAESLASLGVDQTPSPRLDEHGQPLPDDYSPLGGMVRLDPVTEVWIAGVALAGNAAVGSLLEDVMENPPDGGGEYDREVLFSLSETDAPWMSESLPDESFPESKRASAAADLDGDGVEELVTVFHEDDRIAALVVERVGGGFATSEHALVFNVPGVRDVSLAAGDFDGDHAADLAVGYALDAQAWLFFAGLDESGEMEIHPASSMVLEPNFFDSSIELVTEAGNLDHDDSAELVVVVNERSGNRIDPMLTSRYHVIDDRATGYAEVDGGFVEGFEANQGLRVASLADVALGDVDGDHRDEILFGGLEFLADDCDAVPYLVIALDDAPSGFAPIGVRTYDYTFPSCDQVDPYALRFAHVNALDVDGDGKDEVQVDARVFDDWAAADPWTEVAEWSLPNGLFFDDQDLDPWLDETSLAFATGDFDGDAREDVLVWRAGHDELRVYGIAEPDGDVVLHGRIPTEPTAALVNPILVAVDCDEDAPVLEAVGDNELSFVEPMVLAVLAAPPCKEGIGQNTDACQTTFGNSQSSGSEQEYTVSFAASATAGFSVDGGAVTQSEAKVKKTLEVKISGIASHAYQVEKTVSFTTGPNEDTVVFTTIPMDQYAYRILYHPDPDLIGEVVRCFIPREPIFLQVERGFYNDHVVEGGLKIDGDVFTHEIGDPRSYPTKAEKDDLLARYGGLEIGPQSVGQGAGETALELLVSDEYAGGGALELGYEYEAETTILGVNLGFTVGVSAEAELLVTSGQSTTYTGVVGSIPGETFLANQYSFGLFTYVQLDPATGQEFEVINYWVE